MKITLAIDISKKPEEVFPWIAEPDKAMLWQKGVKKGEIIKETPEKIGTTFREEMEDKGKSLAIYGEIIDYVQDKLISFHLESKIHKLDVSYSIVGQGNKSTLTVDSRIHWKFPMNMFSLIIGRKIRDNILQQTESEFSELRRLCETAKA